MELRHMPFAVMIVPLALAVTGCRRKTEAPAERPPRPVTAIRLKRFDPMHYLRLTGSVASWKREDVGFEVGGRVTWTVEEGTDVAGRAFDETGKLIGKGDVLARLDKSRYELQVSAAQAQLAQAKAQSAAAKIESEQVLPEQLKAAQAELTRSSKDHERVKALTERGASTPTELETAEAVFKTARARVDQARATLVAKRAELRAMEANVLQAAEALKQTQKNLQDCELISPFDARVARMHAIPGAYVEPGSAVATVVVMDPIRIDLPVSAATDRAVAYGDVVTVYPPGVEEPILGWVHTKDTIADPATRTFKLTILVRNRKILVDAPKDPSLLKLPRVTDLTGLEREDPAAVDGPLFVDTSALRRDEKGFFVWQVEGFRFAGTPGPQNPVVRAKRVRVVPGEKRVGVLSFVFRELVDSGGLGAFDALIPNPSGGLQDGARMLLVRKRWMLRPGDLVPVALRPPASAPGLYVPMEAVRPEGGTHYVFVADQGRARKVEVRLTGAFGELRRIEGEGVREGTLVVLEGTHYLVPEERVSVAEVKETQ